MKIQLLTLAFYKSEIIVGTKLNLGIWEGKKEDILI
jgi:hypothetical protein